MFLGVAASLWIGTLAVVTTTSAATLPQAPPSIPSILPTPAPEVSDTASSPASSGDADSDDPSVWQWIAFGVLIAAALAALALARRAGPDATAVSSTPELLAQLRQIATRSASTVPSSEEVSYQIAALDSLRPILDSVWAATSDEARRAAFSELGAAISDLRAALKAVEGHVDPKQARSDVHAAAIALGERVAAVRTGDEPPVI